MGRFQWTRIPVPPPQSSSTPRTQPPPQQKEQQKQRQQKGQKQKPDGGEEEVKKEERQIGNQYRNEVKPSRREPLIIGRNENPKETWRWSKERGFDLTHTHRPSSDDRLDGGGDCSREPRGLQLRMRTWNSPITIAAAKTAMVIIDMQNILLCRGLCDRKEPHKAMRALLDVGIPAARQAGIQIIWLNWGLTSKDLESLPPSVDRVFRFGIHGNLLVDQGIDKDLGEIELEPDEVPEPAEAAIAGGEGSRSTLVGSTLDGSSGGSTSNGGKRRVDAGRFLVKGEFNTQLYAPLLRSYQESLKAAEPQASTPTPPSASSGPSQPRDQHDRQGQPLSSPAQLPDVLFHKNRISGLCEASRRPDGNDLHTFLEKSKLKTLLFAGINVDFCVMATLQDANMLGYDTVLLTDAAETINGKTARKAAYNSCRRGWGFRSTCADLKDAVDAACGGAPGDAMGGASGEHGGATHKRSSLWGARFGR